MRTTTGVVTGAMVAVLLSAAPGAAQERRVFGMIGVGPAVPVGAFGDGFGTGWDLTAGVGVALKRIPVELRGQLSYGSFKESGSTGSSGSSKPRGLTADVLYRLGNGDSKVRPYLVGGVGFSSIKYSSSYNVPGESGGGGDGFAETDSGISFGAGGGLAVRVGSLGVFAEARYTSIPGSGHSHLPLVVGVRFGRQ